MREIKTMPCSKKVLITGGSGLIGSEILDILKNKGYEIYPISRKHWIKGDIFDYNFLKNTIEKIKPNYLLNLAWCSKDDYLKNDINYQYLIAGINLLNLFKDNGGQRAMYIGSCFEYKFKDEKIKETDELDCAKTKYTFCKNKLREICEYISKENNLSFCWGRIFYVFGKNDYQKRLFGMVLDKLSKNEKVIIKTPDLIKDYIYTKDIAGAIAELLNSNVNGSINICSSTPITIKNFVLKIAKKMNKEHLIIFEQEETNQPKIILGDNSKMLNYYTPKYTIDSALEDIING